MPFHRNVHPGQHHRSEEEKKFSADKSELDSLRTSILALSELAFRRYAKAHGASKDIEELEWTRYKKILKEMM